MSAICINCESHVSADYARVFSTREDGHVEVCPDCEDLKRGADGRPEERRFIEESAQPAGGDDLAEVAEV